MDMYQKRKMRAEKKNNDSQESFSKAPISWEIPAYGKPHRNTYK